MAVPPLNTLVANRLFEMDLVRQHQLCLNLLICVSFGHATVHLDTRSGLASSVGSDGSEIALFPIDNEQLRSLLLADLTRATEELAGLGPENNGSGRFLLVIGSHPVPVDVEKTRADSHKSITLRMHGASELQEQARAMLFRFMDEAEDRPMFLSFDGEHILGHGTLFPQHRRAKRIEIARILGWYLGCIALACGLYALTPLPAVLGPPGWIISILAGLVFALGVAPYVFGGDEQPWSTAAPSGMPPLARAPSDEDL